MTFVTFIIFHRPLQARRMTKNWPMNATIHYLMIQSLFKIRAFRALPSLMLPFFSRKRSLAMANFQSRKRQLTRLFPVCVLVMNTLSVVSNAIVLLRTRSATGNSISVTWLSKLAVVFTIFAYSSDPGIMTSLKNSFLSESL